MITNKEKNFLSAVVYVHNNQTTIGDFLIKVYSVLHRNFENFEIICVNDASTDRSTAIIKEYFEQMPDCALSVVNMSFYQGLETAMNAGIDLAIGDFVFEFDIPNMDYSLQTIMDVYNHLLEGYDIVAASNSKKRFVSDMFYRVYNQSANAQYKLASESFRVLSRRAINRVHSMSKTLPYRKALYSNCGLKNYMLLYHASTDSGKAFHTRQQTKNRQDTAVNTLILFTSVAYKISIGFTILMMLATLLTAAYVLTVFLLKQPVPGFTPIMLVLTGSFFGVFAILAIVIKYLSLLVDLVFRKQKYIIESIEKITR